MTYSQDFTGSTSSGKAPGNGLLSSRTRQKLKVGGEQWKQKQNLCAKPSVKVCYVPIVEKA